MSLESPLGTAPELAGPTPTLESLTSPAVVNVAVFVGVGLVIYWAAKSMFKTMSSN